MFPRPLAAALLLALALPAAAQAPDTKKVPAGYVQIEKVDKVRLWAPSKDALSSSARLAFFAGVKEIVNTYESIYHLDHELVVMGRGGKTIRKDLDMELDVVLFRDRDAWKEWLNVGENDPMVAHVGHARAVVGVPIEANGVQEWVWPVLWHEFSHLYLRNDIATGGPPWLDEGVAEYFAFQNKRMPKPQDSPSFDLMVARLRTRFEKKEIPPIGEMLHARPGQFDRFAMDGSWVLVHLLMTEGKESLNGIIRRVAFLEGCTIPGNEDGAREDIVRYGAWLAEQAFRGRKELQAAWEYHWSKVMDSPVNTQRLAKGVPGLKDTPQFLEFDGGFTEPMEIKENGKKIGFGRTTRGQLIYGAPWAGTVTVRVHRGRLEDQLMGDLQVVTAGTNEKMEPVPLKNTKIIINGERAWLIVVWDVTGGGRYEYAREYEFPR